MSITRKTLPAIAITAAISIASMTACTSNPPVNGVSGGSDRAAVKVEPISEENGLYNLADKYENLAEDNAYKVVGFDDMVKFREHGTGILVFGFSTCPACIEYIPMLDELAKEHGIDKIVYYDLKPDRDAQNDNYRKVLEMMEGHTKYNSDGDERLYVPSVSFIDAGEITFYDDETSDLEDDEVLSYWTEERLASWKDRLGEQMDIIKPKIEECSECGAN